MLSISPNASRKPEEDAGTPDEWVPRSSKLIRLTGRHPLNAEPPLSDLMQSAITPNELHYVRNHGAVPRLEWGLHKLTLKGMLNGKSSSDSASAEHCLSMDDLASGRFPIVELPVTLMCDGNRRKELNTLRRTRGFNWGPGGTSTAVWRGVLLADVIDACGGPGDGAKYVWFDWSDQLPSGCYGTSLPLSTAMDRSCDVLLAFGQNGGRLDPDHGYPLRLIVPGQVGGRSVKWLSTVTLSDRETPNHYHWHDNKVLPAQVTSSSGAEEGHWYNPAYTLYEHNVNSVVTSPAHGEVLVLPPPSAPASSTAANGNSPGDSSAAPHEYTLAGYAFSGGGRHIARVDVSLDGGRHWLLAKPAYPTPSSAVSSAKTQAPAASSGSANSHTESPAALSAPPPSPFLSFSPAIPPESIPRHGGQRYWTWAHWTLTVPLAQLEVAEMIQCRAWDASMNTQPEGRVWNGAWQNDLKNHIT